MQFYVSGLYTRLRCGRTVRTERCCKLRLISGFLFFSPDGLLSKQLISETEEAIRSRLKPLLDRAEVRNGEDVFGLHTFIE